MGLPMPGKSYNPPKSNTACCGGANLPYNTPMGIAKIQDFWTSTFIFRFIRLAKPFWSSEERWRVRLLVLAFLGLSVAQIVVQVRINLWSAGLFNALEQHSMDGFFLQLEVLALILASGMTISTTHMMVKRRLQLMWRRWLTKRVLDQWICRGHQVQVTYIPGDHDNPDGRIAEDIRTTVESAIDLAHSFFYCCLLLVSFTQILWSLSGTITVDVRMMTFTIPGHMVWIALIYSTAATTLALIVGWPLIRAQDRRQTAEANFRFGLVHVRENAESIALLHGEADERRHLSKLFSGIRNSWDRQSAAIGRLFLFTSGYAILSTAFPIMVAAPRFISGTITLGTLMQTAQAFQQMASALSWPIDNLQKVAEWRASVERVIKLQDALTQISNGHTPEGAAINVTHAPGNQLVFEHLSIGSPSGDTILSKFNATVDRGERVLISGDPTAAIHLFKVVAGLWPWGTGQVTIPEGTRIFFMPRRPYLPVGSLRDAIAYPSPLAAYASTFNEEMALNRVGLDYLIPRLAEEATWEDCLSLDEQQRLGFARLLLHSPDWIFIEEATDSLTPEAEVQIFTMLIAELPNATLLTIGYHNCLGTFHNRTIVPAERRRSGRTAQTPGVKRGGPRSKN